MPQDPTKDEINRLTPQERAAIENADPEPGEVPADEEPNTHHSLGNAPVEDAPVAAPPAAAKEPVVELEDRGEEPFAVAYAYDPSSFDEQRAQADLKTLDEQFQNGEIELGDYNKGRDSIRELITEHKVATKISQEMQGQVAMAKWNAIVETFLDQDVNAVYKKDYPKFAALDATIKSLAGDKRFSNKSESWIIKEADRIVRASFGVPGAPSVPKDPKAEAIAARRPATQIPRTLGEVPAAAPSVDSEEFAGVNSLNNGTPEGQIKFERALAKMTPDQQARFLES